MPNEEILAVKNSHPAASGHPPMFRTGEGYISYFENDRGEQWVFSMDWKSEVFFLAGGNIGWEERTIGEPGLKDLVLGVPEQLWNKAQVTDSGNFKWRYLRRLLILIAFGLVHGIFLYSADVLVVYGIAGLVLVSVSGLNAGSLMRGGFFVLLLSIFVNVMLEMPSQGIVLRPVLIMVVLSFGILFLVRRASARTYMVVGLVVMIGGSAQLYWSNSDGYASGPEYQKAQEIQRQQAKADLHASLDRSVIEVDGQLVPMPPPGEVLDQIEAGKSEAPTLDYLSFAAGTYGMATRARIEDFKLILLLGLVYFGWRTLGLFLIAAGLMKWGIANPNNKALWRRGAWVGLGLGIPISILNTMALGFSYEAENLFTVAIPLVHEISSLLLAAGLGSLAFLWADSSRLDRLKKALSGVGRMALTNYLGQSLIMSLIAGGYGMGLYGKLTHLQLIAVYVMRLTL